jgi:hypothetical protein
MFIRKAVVEFLELWSEAGSFPGDEDEWSWWVIDWRWLTSHDGEQPPFISECVLIH